MNNSFIAIENVKLDLETPVDNTVQYRERETDLMAIVDAFEEIGKSRAWSVLKDKIFDGVLISLERRLKTEIKKKPLNGPLIHSLNGQIEWAEKYTNFDTLASIYKLELSNIRKKLNAT